MPPGSVEAAFALRTASARLEGGVEVQSGGPPRWRQPEEPVRVVVVGVAAVAAKFAFALALALSVLLHPAMNASNASKHVPAKSL